MTMKVYSALSRFLELEHRNKMLSYALVWTPIEGSRTFSAEDEVSVY